MSERCSQPECDKTAHAKGLCPMHYQRLRKVGDPTRTKFPPLRARFDAYVTKTDGCWLWTGATNENGYGVLSAPKGMPRLAHRMSYELANGAGSAAGLMVCHNCDNPPCVNPAHLFLGTNLDNVRDMQAKGRASRVPRVVGAAHPQAKLSDANVLAIRQRRAEGELVAALAAGFGLSVSAINRIVNRHTWRHI